MNKAKQMMMVLFGVLIVTSCATTNSASFSKRKYTNGVFSDRAEKMKSSDKDKVEDEFDIFKTENKKNKKFMTSHTINLEEQSVESTAFYAEESNAAVASISDAPVINDIQLNEKSETVVVKDANSISSNESVVKTKDAKKEMKKTESSNRAALSGGMLVLCVILCLFPFINLIPVYIHDGSVNMNFWLTLILDILFFLPGIIFSLLVVLDVVSLA